MTPPSQSHKFIPLSLPKAQEQVGCWPRLRSAWGGAVLHFRRPHPIRVALEFHDYTFSFSDPSCRFPRKSKGSDTRSDIFYFPADGSSLSLCFNRDLHITFTLQQVSWFSVGVVFWVTCTTNIISARVWLPHGVLSSSILSFTHRPEFHELRVFGFARRTCLWRIRTVRTQ
jgi:hypothetical protein